MDEKKTVAVEAASADEYSKTAVPMTARKSFMSALIISLGYVFVVTSMQAGSAIGVGLSFNSMVIAPPAPSSFTVTGLRYSDRPVLHHGRYRR